jgi:hypothetical protein
MPRGRCKLIPGGPTVLNLLERDDLLPEKPCEYCKTSGKTHGGQPCMPCGGTGFQPTAYGLALLRFLERHQGRRNGRPA